MFQNFFSRMKFYITDFFIQNEFFILVSEFSFLKHNNFFSGFFFSECIIFPSLDFFVRNRILIFVRNKCSPHDAIDPFLDFLLQHRFAIQLFPLQIQIYFLTIRLLLLLLVPLSRAEEQPVRFRLEAAFAFEREGVAVACIIFSEH